MEFAGLEDNGKIKGNCLGCGKEILSVWSVGEDQEMTTDIKVKCCFCDDDTGIISVTGKIYIGAGDDAESLDMMDCDVPTSKGETMNSIYQAIGKVE